MDKLDFCAGTKVFEEALNAITFLDWLKKFGPAQNILEPVEGQGTVVDRVHKKKIGRGHYNQHYPRVRTK